MRKVLAAGMAAITFGGAMAAALPAAADEHGWHGDHHGYRGEYGGYRGDYGDYRGDWDHHRRHGDNAAAAALVAGIAGLAIGAALTDGNHRTYSRGYYAPGYYDYGYRPYAMCESRRWVWDPYIGRRVMVTSRYEC